MCRGAHFGTALMTDFMLGMCTSSTGINLKRNFSLSWVAESYSTSPCLDANHNHLDRLTAWEKGTDKEAWPRRIVPLSNWGSRDSIPATFIGLPNVTCGREESSHTK